MSHCFSYRHEYTCSSLSTGPVWKLTKKLRENKAKRFSLSIREMCVYVLSHFPLFLFKKHTIYTQRGYYVSIDAFSDIMQQERWNNQNYVTAHVIIRPIFRATRKWIQYNDDDTATIGWVSWVNYPGQRVSGCPVSNTGTFMSNEMFGSGEEIWRGNFFSSLRRIRLLAFDYSEASIVYPTTGFVKIWPVVFEKDVGLELVSR